MVFGHKPRQGAVGVPFLPTRRGSSRREAGAIIGSPRPGNAGAVASSWTQRLSTRLYEGIDALAVLPNEASHTTSCKARYKTVLTPTTRREMAKRRTHAGRILRGCIATGFPDPDRCRTADTIGNSCRNVSIIDSRMESRAARYGNSSTSFPSAENRSEKLRGSQTSKCCGRQFKTTSTDSSVDPPAFSNHICCVITGKLPLLSSLGIE